MGCNHDDAHFRILKIDRTLTHDLGLSDDGIAYSKEQMIELLKTLEMGNRSTGFRMVTHFFGIVGFVRFLEGFYLIIITRKSPVAYL